MVLLDKLFIGYNIFLKKKKCIKQVNGLSLKISQSRQMSYFENIYLTK